MLSSTSKQAPPTDEGKSLRLSIIIVNWNVGDLVVEAIKSVYECSGLPQDDYEIIIVDNASSDDSVATIQKHYPNIPLIASNENLGFGRANDLAYRECKGQFVFLLNPDTIVTNNAIATLLTIIQEDSTIGIVGPRLLNEDRTFQRSGGGAYPGLLNLFWNYFFLNRIVPESLSPKALYIEGDPQGTFDIDWISGAALMIRPEAIDGPLFDPSFFMYGEDIELCYRVKQNDWRVAYTSKASIVHYNGQSMRRQNEAHVMAAPIKGPRAFYVMRFGTWGLIPFDLILFLGYLFRWPAFKILGLLKKDRNYLELSRMSFHYMKASLRFLLRIDST